MIPLPFSFSWLKLGAMAVAAVVAVTAYLGWRGAQRDYGRAEVRAEWAAEREAQKDAAIQQASDNARETLRRLERQKKAQDDHDTALARAQADARRASVAAAGLRDQLAAFAAAHRGARSHPATAGDGPPAGDPIGVLADVLRRADERAGILAEFADAAHLAGQQCVRAYDSLTGR